jgi:hypothetical protein
VATLFSSLTGRFHPRFSFPRDFPRGRKWRTPAPSNPGSFSATGARLCINNARKGGNGKFAAKPRLAANCQTSTDYKVIARVRLDRRIL